MRYFEVKKPRIEIIPMIDIMLFLLVFFVMLTLSMIPTSGLIGHLPSSKTSQDLPPLKVMIEVHEDGHLVVDQVSMSMSALQDKLRQVQSNSSKTIVTIAGSAKVSLQQLTDVMDACRQTGITQIGLSTQSSAR
jgi:biopolymer transport protein ExbD